MDVSEDPFVYALEGKLEHPGSNSESFETDDARKEQVMQYGSVTREERKNGEPGNPAPIGPPKLRLTSPVELSATLA
jgi:hypothetical protein